MLCSSTIAILCQLIIGIPTPSSPNRCANLYAAQLMLAKTGKKYM